MADRKSLARAASKMAFKFRLENGVGFDEPIDIYEMIRRIGMDLQFMDVPSLEGMYLNEPDSLRICVTAHRPGGRQRFTAAHELGHHVLNHGSTVEDVVDLQCRYDHLSFDEIGADAFASIVLMPPAAVHAAFRGRGADPAVPSAPEVYRAACWLGVGYDTLIKQMHWTLKLINRKVYDSLRKVRPMEIKTALLGCPPAGDVWPLDAPWGGRRLHAQVDDVILGIDPEQSLLSTGSSLVPDSGTTGYRAVAPGEIELLLSAGGKVKISVSKSNFVGFYEYRYFQE